MFQLYLDDQKVYSPMLYQEANIWLMLLAATFPNSVVKIVAMPS